MYIKNIYFFIINFDILIKQECELGFICKYIGVIYMYIEGKLFISQLGVLN